MTNACISTVTVKNKTEHAISRGGNPVANDGHYESLPPVKTKANSTAKFVMKANSGEWSLSLVFTCVQSGIE